MASEVKQDHVGVVLVHEGVFEDHRPIPFEEALCEGGEILDKTYRPRDRVYEYVIRHPDLDPIPEGSLSAPRYIAEFRTESISMLPKRTRFERVS